jgi:hypothetical protein
MGKGKILKQRFHFLREKVSKVKLVLELQDRSLDCRCHDKGIEMAFLGHFFDKL